MEEFDLLPWSSCVIARIAKRGIRRENKFYGCANWLVSAQKF